MLEMAVPVKSADVPQIQGAMLVNISISDIMATVGEQEQMAMLLTGIIVALSVLLAYGLSTILVKPLASVTKSIEDPVSYTHLVRKNDAQCVQVK